MENMPPLLKSESKDRVIQLDQIKVKYNSCALIKFDLPKDQEIVVWFKEDEEPACVRLIHGDDITEDNKITFPRHLHYKIIRLSKIENTVSVLLLSKEIK
jgi:hypothetical protein